MLNTYLLYIPFLLLMIDTACQAESEVRPGLLLLLSRLRSRGASLLLCFSRTSQQPRPSNYHHAHLPETPNTASSDLAVTVIALI